jgi:hypothetical protein
VSVVQHPAADDAGNQQLNTCACIAQRLLACSLDSDGLALAAAEQGVAACLLLLLLLLLTAAAWALACMDRGDVQSEILRMYAHRTACSSH